VTAGANVPHPGAVVGTLLAHAIDYAGLFPPAQLDMPGAVAEYASYVASPDAWALGRFVVPAGRLDELATVASEGPPSHERSLGSAPWGFRLSAVLGADLASDGERVVAFNAAHQYHEPQRWWSAVDAVELRAPTVDAVVRALRTVPHDLDRFVEIPVTGDPALLLRAIGTAGAFAKVRTGGTSPDAFPSSDDLARFLATCVAERVRFKATAGLHHPLRGEYALTYEPESANATMYGFLNVFLATALLRAGMPQSVARELLEEQDSKAVLFDDRGVRWRTHRLSVDQLLDAREIAIQSFGSCSFREPIDDLTALGIL